MRVIRSQTGSALLIALAIMLLVFLAVILSVNNTITETDLSFNQIHSDKAFYIALAGVEQATAELDNDVDWRTGFAMEPFDNGAFTVILVDSSVNPGLEDTLQLRSVGEYDKSQSVIGVLLLQEKYHPLYNHAIYAGNHTEYDPLADSQLWVSSMNFGGTGSTRDIITGDIHFNGHVDFSGDAELNGNATVGGDYTGNTPSGSSETNADYLEPPDLKAQDYETNSDFVVSGTSGWDGSGRLPSSDPRHIFVKDFRKDLATTYGYNFDNDNYFFGDPWEGSNINRISVSSSGNHKVYFVDGNLWIEPQGQVSQLVKSPPDGTQITVVVKGNIYFSDDLTYNNPDLDALAFIAMTDGESYTDKNGNSQYDSGEPILHDDGDGVYEGPSEGSGNIRFGDPNGGPLGDIHGFLYAENNFEDYVLDGPNGDPQNFSVTGMLSAGNHLDINRDYGGEHSQMKVTYDERLKNGEIDLPGLPKRNLTGSDSWVQVAWREL